MTRCKLRSDGVAAPLLPRYIIFVGFDDVKLFYPDQWYYLLCVTHEVGRGEGSLRGRGKRKEGGHPEDPSRTVTHRLISRYVHLYDYILAICSYWASQEWRPTRKCAKPT